MKKDNLLIVGAFPSSRSKIIGGLITDCRMLLKSSLSQKFNFIKIDSTQISNPPPNIFIRAIHALKKIIILLFKIIIYRPKVALLFVAVGASVLEKSLMIIICKFFGISSLIFPRGGRLIDDYYESKFMRFVCNKFLSKADIFCCQGRRFQDFAINKLNYKISKTPIIPNWTASQELLSLKNNCDPNDNNILFIGWLEEFKGIKELMQAILKLKKSGYKFKLSIAGDGNLFSYTAKFVRDNDLQNYVELLGWVSQKKMLPTLSCHDIFVLPSWEEGFPNSLVEAMSAGLASIVTDVGMIKDFVEHEKHSLIIPPKSSDFIYESLVLLIENKSLRKKLIKNSKNLSRQIFHVENASKILERSILELK